MQRAKFVLARGVTMIVNHGELVNGEDPDIVRNVQDLLGPTFRVRQVHREEYVYAGTAGGTSGTRRMATFVYELGGFPHRSTELPSRSLPASLRVGPTSSRLCPVGQPPTT